MFVPLLAPLLQTLRPHFDLGKTGLETLAVLLVGLANGRTVNLSHLASLSPARHCTPRNIAACNASSSMSVLTEIWWRG